MAIKKQIKIKLRIGKRYRIDFYDHKFPDYTHFSGVGVYKGKDSRYKDDYTFYLPSKGYESVFSRIDIKGYA